MLNLVVVVIVLTWLTWAFLRLEKNAECRHINTVNLLSKIVMETLNFFAISEIKQKESGKIKKTKKSKEGTPE
jgi:hypothetical protein